jgi:hypothetical protein
MVALGREDSAIENDRRKNAGDAQLQERQIFILWKIP